MLRINTGPEMAKMLEQARRSMNALKGSVSRVSSSVELESAGDDPVRSDLLHSLRMRYQGFSAPYEISMKRSRSHKHSPKISS